MGDEHLSVFIMDFRLWGFGYFTDGMPCERSVQVFFRTPSVVGLGRGSGDLGSGVES